MDDLKHFEQIWLLKWISTLKACEYYSTLWILHTQWKADILLDRL